MVGYFYCAAQPGAGTPPASEAPINNYIIAEINGVRGDYDPSRIGWPPSPSDASAPATPPTIPTTNSNFAARPASNHPGGVIVTFAGANTKFLKEEIDYRVYCLLMTPNGVKATTKNPGWQKNLPLDEGSL